jgi:LPXTG-motif cell wall-anchored protein
LQVLTPLRKVSSGDNINIWYIIGGIVGGLILLILIALLAWKVREIYFSFFLLK